MALAADPSPASSLRVPAPTPEEDGAPRKAPGGTGPDVRWPEGHSGWFFAGAEAFEGRVAGFLADGIARGERAVLVADEPGADRWPPTLLDRGDLVVASTAEIYGPDLVVEAGAQRAAFAGMLAGSLAVGYRGLRVAADNTSLVAGPERLAAWLAWEAVADQFMVANPVTGMCAFDVRRIDAQARRLLAGVHERSVS